MPTPTEQQIINGIICDAEFSRTVVPHLRPDYFSDDGTRTIVRIIINFYDKYHSSPSVESLAIDLQGEKGLSQAQFDGAKDILGLIAAPEVDYRWLLDRTESFCQDRALYGALMTVIKIVDREPGSNSAPGISKGEIPHILQEALGVTFDKRVGHDYLNESELRYEFYTNTDARVPFDLTMLNRITHGGLMNKTLTVFTSGTGVGKTTVMCHMACANMLSGYNVLYITMEMAETLIAQRIDANLLDIDINELSHVERGRYDSAVAALRSKCHADIIVKEFPTSGANVNHFRHLLSELKSKKSFVPNIVYVDYLNICAPARYKSRDGVSSYAAVKAIAEELRGLAIENDVPIVSATQFNRAGSASDDPELTDVSDSFGTPMTADLQLAISSTPDMELRHLLMWKQLKNRYGTLQPLKFVTGIDRSRMRLYDDGNVENDEFVPPPSSAKLNSSRAPASHSDYASFDFT